MRNVETEATIHFNAFPCWRSHVERKCEFSIGSDVRACDRMSGREPFAMQFEDAFFSCCEKMLSHRQAVPNAPKTEKWERREKRANEQQAAHNLKWLPFYLRRILCFLASLYAVDALVFGGFVHNHFRFFFVRCFVFFSIVSVVTTTTTTFLLPLSFVAVAVIVSFHLNWKICKRQAAEAQPTEVKEHEILAKNGQTKQWFREINKTKKRRENEERKTNEGPNNFFCLTFFAFENCFC